jgi:Ni/Co efflux regulator RcnB
MKIAMTALAVVLLAGATSAAAAPGGRADREWGGHRGPRDGAAAAPRAPRVAPAPRAPQAPRAAEPPRAAGPPRAAEPRRDGGYRGREAVHRGGGERRGGGRDFRDGGRGGVSSDRDRHGGGHDAGRGGWRPGGDRHDGHGYGRDHGPGWDRGDHRARGWDGRGDRWVRGRYPSVYFSSHRYRHAWRPPVGYYARAWSFGDYLPHGWFGPDWWLGDPWAYGLPLPPPGFDWVRVGDDALLVDQFTGRIVQVVRDVFW